MPFTSFLGMQQHTCRLKLFWSGMAASNGETLGARVACCLSDGHAERLLMMTVMVTAAHHLGPLCNRGAPPFPTHSSESAREKGDGKRGLGFSQSFSACAERRGRRVQLSP